MESLRLIRNAVQKISVPICQGGVYQRGNFPSLAKNAPLLPPSQVTSSPQRQTREQRFQFQMPHRCAHHRIHHPLWVYSPVRNFLGTPAMGQGNS